MYCLLVYTSASSSLWPSSSLKSPPVSFSSTILAFTSLHLAWWSPRSQTSWWWVLLTPLWAVKIIIWPLSSKMHQVFSGMLSFKGGPHDQEWASSSRHSLHWSWTSFSKSVFQQLHWWTHRALDRHGEPQALLGQTTALSVFKCSHLSLSLLHSDV